MVCIYTHAMEHYPDIKKNEVMPFTATWMNLESMMLSEISQTAKTNIVYYHLYAENKLVNITKKETDSQIKRTNQ